VGAMSRRKGAAAELAVVQWLRGRGRRTVERRPTGSPDPFGDIAGIPGTVVEVKNHNGLDLAGWATQLEAEMTAAGADTGVVIVKRRGTTDVARWYAVLPVDLWERLMTEAGR
jgi:Holliday junction resolvase